ncbi:MAG: DUF7927 domain-containing protein [Nocardioides sp.]
MVRQPTHRASRYGLSLLLRLLVSLALALLTLPVLSSPASADDSTAAPTTVSATADPAASSDPTSTADPTATATPTATADPTATATPTSTTGTSATSGTGTTTGTGSTGTSSTTTTTRTKSASSFTLATATPAAVSYDAGLKAQLVAAPYQPVDEQGANDEPGQKDLTRLWAYSPSGGSQKIGWNWDDIAWSGTNTGDACALFDTDQDANANYAVCVTVANDPATQLDTASNPSPRLYSCNDTRSTTCTGPTLLSSGAGSTVDCQVGLTDTDPFPNGGAKPGDTSALCDIPLSAVGGASTMLTNVCSYPSQQPNSDYSDCVLSPRDALLTVKKVATPVDGTSFPFTVTTGGVSQDFASLKSGEQFSGGIASGRTVDLAEALPSGWSQVSASCDNGQSPDALNIASGGHVTCTFTNTKAAQLTVTKNWVINGVGYTNATKPTGYSASLTLDGHAADFGTSYDYTAGDVVTVDETYAVPDGCTDVKSGDTGDHTLAGGPNALQITNTVTCPATVRVDKTWVVNGTTYADPGQPDGYTAAPTLDGTTKAFETTYGGYVEGQSVTIGEPDANVTVPTGCAVVTSGDLGSRTLAKGANVFTITNTVTCASTVEVDKVWMINGTRYVGANPLTGYSASYTLDGDAKDYASTYGGYVQGDTVTIAEPDSAVTVPSGCTTVASGDLGSRTLAKGANVYTVTNTVTCPATVRVNKLWVINGTTYTDAQRPDGYAGTPTIAGATKAFGTTYDGYVQDQQVVIGENPPTIPVGCENRASGDLGTKTLAKGTNIFTITNTVTCAATVEVDKHWVINGVGYDGAAPLDGYSATLVLDSTAGQFGHVYSGYLQGQVVGIDETWSVPQGCTNVASGDTGTRTLAKGANTYTITNTVTCAATVEVLKTWTINGVSYAGASPLAGYSATPTIGGDTREFGKVYSGFVQGQQVGIDENAPVIPTGCVNVKSGDTGTKTLAKGANTYTIHNTVTCAASVRVDKTWVINGITYADPAQPTEYSGTPTIDGTSGEFGHEYGGFTQGDVVTIGETVDLPSGCVNTATGDTGDRTLGKGLNTFAITNTVNCAAGVQVDKLWVVNGTTYANGDQPSYLSAALRINDKAAAFGKFYDGFRQGDALTLDESTTIDNAQCSLDSARVTLADGATVDESLPFSTTAGRGANGYTLTNTVTCRSTLTLVKVVDNGDAKASAWTLSATSGDKDTVDGPTGRTGTSGDVTPGARYALSESGGPAYYTAAGPWACTNGVTVSAGSVSVPMGVATTCTVHNVTSTLVLAKQVTNSFNGTATPASFQLTATPAAGAPQGVAKVDVIGNADGVATYVRPGVTYDLTESSLSGYHLASLTCGSGRDATATASVSVPAGTTVTCTYRNVDEPASLTLVKHVVNTGTDGTAVPTDWTLSAAHGQDGVSGKGGASGDVPAGTYTLSELADAIDRTAGYTASGWTCNGRQTDGTVTVALGSTTTCEITNTATAGTWLVSKSSDPATGSTVQPGDVITYTVTATKTGGVDPTGVTVLDDLSQVLDHATLVPGSVVTSTGTAAVDPATSTMTWTVPTLHGTQTVSYQVRVDDGAYGVTLKNLVTSPGSEQCPELAPDCHTTEHYTPAWSLTKTSDPATGSTVQPGDTVTYTLHALNTSKATVAGASATDDLSDVLDNATLDPASLPEGLTLDGTALTWAVPTLAAGAPEATVSYTVTVGDGQWDESLVNVVTPGGAGGSCPTAADCTTDHVTPAWTLTKTSDPQDGASVDPGSTITYTLTATNPSDGVVAGAQAVDDLSKVLDHASLDASTLPDGLALDGTTLTWTLPTLQPGDTASVSYTVTVDADASAVVLDNVVVPVGAGGTCVTAEDCRTHHTTPEILGKQIFRPRPPVVKGVEAVLPATGAPESGRLLGLVGALTAGLGALLMAGDRRRRSEERR